MIAVISGAVGAAIALALAIPIVRHRLRTQLVDAVGALGVTPDNDSSMSSVLAQIERTANHVRRHESATARSQLRLEQALSSMTQGAVICDERGEVVLRNAFARAFVDARHGDALVGVAIDELLDEALSGSTADREIEIHGTPKRTLFVHASPLEDRHGLLGAIATVDDISEQQRIDAIRRDFVANISHELKTPVGALALLGETIADEDDPEVVRRLAARMRDESFRVSRVIDDLLALSRIEGEGAQEVENVRIALVVSEAIDRVRPAADQHGVRVHVADIDSELSLRGDRRQLISALFNLLENAVKYSDPDSIVEVRAVGNDGEVSMVVQDHGIGIPAKDLNRIFERFYRVDQARSRETGGTGLGLAIVRHVARNHGGDVTVSSREGEGSTFMLVLPSRVDVTTKAKV
jgi:two-component system sensor histidine kinase SenX3